MPKETFKNEQRIESPLENWPGYIVIPKELDEEQFCTWWEKDKAADMDDSRPDELKAWDTRRHLLLDFQLGDLTPENFPPGAKVKSLPLAMWVIAETQSLILRAKSLPNLRRPSKGTTPLTAAPVQTRATT